MGSTELDYDRNEFSTPQKVHSESIQTSYKVNLPQRQPPRCPYNDYSRPSCACGGGEMTYGPYLTPISTTYRSNDPQSGYVRYEVTQPAAHYPPQFPYQHHQ